MNYTVIENRNSRAAEIRSDVRNKFSIINGIERNTKQYIEFMKQQLTGLPFQIHISINFVYENRQFGK